MKSGRGRGCGGRLPRSAVVDAVWRGQLAGGADDDHPTCPNCPSYPLVDEVTSPASGSNNGPTPEERTPLDSFGLWALAGNAAVGADDTPPNTPSRATHAAASPPTAPPRTQANPPMHHLARRPHPALEPAASAAAHSACQN